MSIPPDGQNGSYTYASFDGDQSKERNAPKRNFLWWCAGAYQKLLALYPSEYTKYSGIGGVILATFVLAALSSGYAIYSVFGDISWTILFACTWGLIIFNFDRFLVSTMRKYGVSFAKQVQLALPRFILALLIGLTIARPLELKIFEKEIEVKVEENRHKKVLLNDSLLKLENNNVLQTATNERQRAASRKASLEDSLRKLQQDYVKEADGTGGSGKRGVEKLTLLKMDAYHAALAQHSPELISLQAQLLTQDSILTQLQAATEVKRKEYETGLQTKVGFLEKNKALSDLSNDETSVFWANFFVSLLIILIEIGPILSKLIVNIGPYDIALAKMELLQMASSENEIIRDKEMVGDKFKNIYQQKKEVSEELVQKITALQRGHINKDLDEWENGKWKESSSVEPLDKVVRSIKTKYDYKEENIL